MFGLPGGSGPFGVGMTGCAFWGGLVVGLAVIGGFFWLFYHMLKDVL